MLTHSHKPQILRLHQIQSRERTRFSGSFLSALSELLPASANNALRSQQLLGRAVGALPDVYYTLVTLCACRRRLGEEYTYIAMYKQQHYQEEGVLLNRKTRALLSLLEIVARHLLPPLLARALNPRAFEESKTGSQKPPPLSAVGRLMRACGRVREAAGRWLGSAEEMMSSVEWLILMVYMLDWNRHFTFIETLLGIRYVYTYKNDQIRDVSYQVEGYLLLATFAVKIAKTLYAAYRETQRKDRGEEKQKQQGKIGSVDPKEGQEGQEGRERPLCRICYDEIKQRSATKCGHTFCWDCIIKTLEMSSECPVCRSSCLPREVVQLRSA